MSTEPRCANCDHFRFYHASEPSEYYLATGGPVMDYWYGRCGYIDRSAYPVRRPHDPFEYQEGDVIDVTFPSGVTRPYRIVRVADIPPHFDLEAIE